MSRSTIENELAQIRSEIEEDAELQKGINQGITQSPYVVLSSDISVNFPNGIIGSISQLPDGSPYLLAGDNIILSTGSYGQITIAAPDVLGHLDQTIQYNKNSKKFGHIQFTFNEAIDTLSVTNISSSIQYLPDNTKFLTGTTGIDISNILNAGILISKTKEEWETYTPQVIGFDGNPSFSNVSGRFSYFDNILKILVDIPTPTNQGNGKFVIRIPPGFSIKTDILPVVNTENPLLGIPVGVGTIHDTGISTWCVVPVNTNKLALIGKNDANQTKIWGSDTVTISNNYKVSFTAIIPAIKTNIITNTGTQYVSGQLSFGTGSKIYLYASVFDIAGDYILFDYSDGTFPGGQTQLNNVTLVDVDLSTMGVCLPATSGPTVLIDDTTNSRIILKVISL